MTRATATGLLAAFGYACSTGRRVLGASVAAAVAYGVLVLSAFPSYTAQMVRADVAYVDDALVALSENTAATAGTVGFALVVLYALTTGVAVVAAVGQLRYGDQSGAGGVTGVLPGLVASGCASCGAGLLGLFGFAGALAALPFHGNLLRFAGIAVLVWFLARTGDPRNCSVDRGAPVE
ncbi:hypothetical protein [Halobacterium litoreum]|uniref:Uncharacterized protein n=1 Tax=Halobacterium litoreum TaxID=2039234 RepID=A0ABD5NFJ8_9EURY|nr:hypothetical protein [Halobacterium litoreum]UHH13057.1 hypothetical protein LT972_12950 [Halobacterium litoreum]